MSEEKLVPKLRFSGFDDEWKSFKLSEISKRITRKNKSLETDRPLTISAQYGLVDQIEYFNKIVASKSLKGYYLLNKGEFAYNKSYSNGYPFGAVKRLDDYENGAISTLYICFNTNDKMNSDLLKEYFETDKWHKEIYKIAVEGARNHGLLNVAVGDFFNTKHVLPTNNHEQEKIAKFLIEINTKIDLLENKHKAYQDFKKYLMQKIFAQELRFENYNEAIYKLSDLYSSKKGTGLSKDKLDEEGLNKCILYGELYTTYNEIIQDVKSKTNSQEGILSKVGDILIPSSTTTKGIDLVTASVILEENVLLSGDITILRSKNENIINNKFFAYYFTNNLVKDVSKLTQGSTIIHLYWKDFKKVKLALPPINEQNKCVDLFLKLDKKIDLINFQIQKMEEFKKGLLQQMFV